MSSIFHRSEEPEFFDWPEEMWDDTVPSTRKVKKRLRESYDRISARVEGKYK